MPHVGLSHEKEIIRYLKGCLIASCVGSFSFLRLIFTYIPAGVDVHIYDYLY